MAADPRQRRSALISFMAANPKLKPFPWSKAAGRSEGQLRGFLAGTSRTMTDAAYDDLAEGATKILQRQVTAAELRGEQVFPREIRVQSFVGAGAEIFAIDGDGDIDGVAAPPDFAGVAMIVKGDSGVPLFEDGDVLFLEPGEKNFSRFLGKVAVVQVKDGPRLVKRIMRGTKAGRYDLQSINPGAPTLSDRVLVEAAGIRWIRRAG